MLPMWTYSHLRAARWLLAIWFVSVLFLGAINPLAFTQLWNASLAFKCGLAAPGVIGYAWILLVVRRTRSRQLSSSSQDLRDCDVLSSFHICGFAGEAFHVLVALSLAVITFQVIAKGMDWRVAVVVLVMPVVIGEYAAIQLSRKIWRHEQRVLNSFKAYFEQVSSSS